MPMIRSVGNTNGPRRCNSSVEPLHPYSASVHRIVPVPHISTFLPGVPHGTPFAAGCVRCAAITPRYTVSSLPLEYDYAAFSEMPRCTSSLHSQEGEHRKF